jgi:hypothetical protein
MSIPLMDREPMTEAVPITPDSAKADGNRISGRCV